MIDSYAVTSNWILRREQYLHVGAICGHELLVNVRAGLSDAAFRRVDAAATANLRPTQTSGDERDWSPGFSFCAYLPEEPLAAPASRGGVVDVDVVVLSTNGFFYKGFREHLPIHLHVVLRLHQITVCTRADLNTAFFSSSFWKTSDLM